MERFIREKYERKKYCASQPPAPRDYSGLGLDGGKAQVIYILKATVFQYYSGATKTPKSSYRSIAKTKCFT